MPVEMEGRRLISRTRSRSPSTSASSSPSSSHAPNAPNDNDNNDNHNTDDNNYSRPGHNHPGASSRLLGSLLGVGSGSFGAAQYATITLGKQYEQQVAGCGPLPPAPPCSWQVEEQFNKMGSWFVSFGVGSMVMTLAFLAVLIVWRALQRLWHTHTSGRTAPDRLRDTPLCPPLHWRVLRSPGLKACASLSLLNDILT